MLLALLGQRLAGLDAAIILRDAEPRFLRQFLDRFDEIQPQVFREESHRIAVGPTAETVVGLARWADDETGGFFTVKWAQTFVVDARFFQLDMPTNHRHHIGSRQQFLNKTGRDHSINPKRSCTKRNRADVSALFLE